MCWDCPRFNSDIYIHSVLITRAAPAPAPAPAPTPDPIPAPAPPCPFACATPHRTRAHNGTHSLAIALVNRPAHVRSRSFRSVSAKEMDLPFSDGSFRVVAHQADVASEVHWGCTIAGMLFAEFGVCEGCDYVKSERDAGGVYRFAADGRHLGRVREGRLQRGRYCTTYGGVGSEVADIESAAERCKTACVVVRATSQQARGSRVVKCSAAVAVQCSQTGEEAGIR
ncbi:hypothetical protein DFH09DRAFT_1104464 [Mycena vulgaris]|nr:hypothetical protein DFH09DRAFT_1104457 [Mycena vulgaris]KAJ6493788.1 hypothetical protein DFH09DRAFT_1104464 [Mycena vulgaris]